MRYYVKAVGSYYYQVRRYYYYYCYYYYCECVGVIHWLSHI